MINSVLFKNIIKLNDMWFNRFQICECKKGYDSDFYNNCGKCFGDLTNMRVETGYDNYHCERLTYYYTCRHLNTFASQIYYALNSKFLKEELSNLKQFNILSLGCGPTPDFIAFDSFNKNHKDIKYVGVDVSKAWDNNHKCIEVYNRNNNMSSPVFHFIDVMQYVSEKRNSEINILIIQNIISTFAKSHKNNLLDIFVSKLFQNIILNSSSDKMYIIVNDVNHPDLLRDEWLRLFIEKSLEYKYKIKKFLFGGYDGIDNCEKYLNNNIVFEYPEQFDINDRYNKSSDCMKYVQLLMKKG